MTKRRVSQVNRFPHLAPRPQVELSLEATKDPVVGRSTYHDPFQFQFVTAISLASTSSRNWKQRSPRGRQEDCAITLVEAVGSHLPHRTKIGKTPSAALHRMILTCTTLRGSLLSFFGIGLFWTTLYCCRCRLSLTPEFLVLPISVELDVSLDNNDSHQNIRTANVTTRLQDQH